MFIFWIISDFKENFNQKNRYNQKNLCLQGAHRLPCMDWFHCKDPWNAWKKILFLWNWERWYVPNQSISLCRIHCRMRTNWQFEFVWVIIPGHSSNDNGNDNQFEQCSSRPCSFSRSVQMFWTCSKIVCTQQCPARILFICGYAYGKRVVIFFVAHLTCCILVILTVFVVVLTVYYVISRWQWDWGRPEDSAK